MRGRASRPSSNNGEFFFGRRHGIRKQLQDVLARHASARLVVRRAAGDPGARGRGRICSILAQPLEYGFAQQVVFRHRAVGDFGLAHRLHPGRLRLLHRLGKRGVFANERIEPLSQVTRHRFGVAAAHLTGVEQPVPLTATHIERGDSPRLRAELLDESHDRKCVAVAVFDFDPAFHPPGAIGRVLLLADDPFKAHGAGALVDLRAVSLQVLGTEDAFG
jgi:hypothetical protein